MDSGLPIALDPSLMMNTPAVGGAAGGDARRWAKIQKAAEDFESVFLATMLREMRHSIPQGGLNEDKAGEGYLEMMDVSLAQCLAHTKQLGLSQVIARQLAKKGEPTEVAGATAVNRSSEHKLAGK